MEQQFLLRSELVNIILTGRKIPEWPYCTARRIIACCNGVSSSRGRGT